MARVKQEWIYLWRMALGGKFSDILKIEPKNTNNTNS